MAIIFRENAPQPGNPLLYNDHPEILPPDDPQILAPADLPGTLPLPRIPPRRIPNFGDTVLFFTVSVIVLLLASFSIFALVMGMHLLGPETPEQLLREPRL